MKALVWHDVGDIRLETVADPEIREPTDAIVRMSASAICGTDLHMIRGTLPGMKEGTILGHEGVGVVEEVGARVTNFKAGDRVVIPSTIACGSCVYCRDGDYAYCDNANPNGALASTAFFGGPAMTGPFDGLQAEYARVPFAQTGLVKIPDDVTDDQAILLSDIFPTGYFGADLADIRPGRTVAVFGCGPVGQFTIASAKLMGAGRIFAIDTVADRLEKAREQGAEIIDYNRDDPVEALREMTSGSGPDRVIDAVGVDAESPNRQETSEQARRQHAQELDQVAPGRKPETNWVPGAAPSQVLDWTVQALAKCGTAAIVGVYPPQAQHFSIGMAMNKHLTLKMGNCNHRAYIPDLMRRVRSGEVDVIGLLTRQEAFTDIEQAYKAFDERRPGWLKVDLKYA